MTNSKFISLIATITMFLCASCTQPAEKRYSLQFSTAPPLLDRTTPDRFLKSIWAYDTWVSPTYADSAFLNAFLKPYLSDRVKKALLDQRAKIASDDSAMIAKFEILKVTTESESRATVLAWEFKDSVLYVLNNPGTGWQVDDRLHKCWNCIGTGQLIDYEAWISSGYPTRIPKKECAECSGKGRMSSY